MNKVSVSLFTIFLIFGIVNGSEIVEVGRCEDSEDSICEIKEVRVEPCKEAKNKKPCKFKSGTNSTIEFDFVPHFEAEKLVSQAYSITPIVDLPLIGMDRDGCKFSQCPAKSDETGTYKNVLFMSAAFPLLNYHVKWRLWDASHDKNGCCFTFKIKIVR